MAHKEIIFAAVNNIGSPLNFRVLAFGYIERNQFINNINTCN